MRRTTVGPCLIMTLMILPPALSAQSLQVTAPKGGESWLLDSAKTIAWAFNGIPSTAKVRIVLWKDGAKLGEIAAGLPIGTNGFGSWSWDKAGTYIGGIASAGPGYEIRIRDSNNQYPLAKSGIFSLTSLSGMTNRLRPLRSAAAAATIAGLVGTIAVSAPAQGSAFKPGEDLWIKWSTSGISSFPQVIIDAYTPDKKTKLGPVATTAHPLLGNTGAYEAHVFNALYEWGKDYVVRVATPDEQHIGWSGVFHIIPLQPVEVTETFTGSHSIGYTSKGESDWIGCYSTIGEEAHWAPSGFEAVGWENTLDDPAGPCWAYVGHAYRTVVNPSKIYQGFVVNKAVLRFSVTQGQKQTFSVWQRTAPGDTFSTPAVLVTKVPGWDFDQEVVVDVTAAVQAWCAGTAPNYGLVIVGGDESFSHNNVKARCVITKPELVITRLIYK